jgi:hypothetical protein
MAQRYSGELVIRVEWKDAVNTGPHGGYYAASISHKGKTLYTVRINSPWHRVDAVDSPESYDRTAAATMAFADASGAGVSDYAAFDEEGFVISRSKAKAWTGRSGGSACGCQKDKKVKSGRAGGQSSGRAREIAEMTAMLKHAGYKNPGAGAVRLRGEGIGPYELEGRIRMGHSGIGSLAHSHGFEREAGRSSGQIRIDRKAHKRRAFVRRDGTPVRAAKVKSTRFLEKDPGRPGRLTRGAKAGPYRHESKWIKNRGALGGPGYTSRSEETRRQILITSIARDGYDTTVKRLRVLLRPTTIGPKARNAVTRDLTWVLSRRRPG